MTQDKKAKEQPSGKPAWFQLVDSDAPSAQVSKIDKKLPVMALIVTGVIAVSGTFLATASEQGEGLNSASPSVSTNTVSDVVDTNASSGSTSSAAPVNSNSTLNVSSPAEKTNGIQNPAQGGITAPRGDDDGDDHWGWLPGHDDDEDDDDEDDDDHDDDDHEREERH